MIWARGHKYKAKRTFLDGHSFASQAEAARYAQLKLLERGGAISNLELQPRYTLEANGLKICEYRADFAYDCRDRGRRIVEDVKGMRTDVYALKKKLMKALLGVDVVEIRNGRPVDPDVPRRRRRRKVKELY